MADDDDEVVEGAHCVGDLLSPCVRLFRSGRKDH